MLFRKTEVNWLDLVIVTMVAAIITMLFKLIANYFSFDLTLENSNVGSPLGFVICAPLLIFYFKDLRQKIMSIDFIEKYGMLPKPVKNRPQVSILGLFAVLFTYGGALISILTIYFAPGPLEKPTYLSDEEIRVQVSQELENQKAYAMVEAIANAKKVTVSKEDLENMKTTSAEEMQKAFEESAPLADEKLFEKLKEQSSEETEKTFLETRKLRIKSSIEFFFAGIAFILLGALIDKLNNMLLLKKEKAFEQ